MSLKEAYSRDDAIASRSRSLGGAVDNRLYLVRSDRYPSRRAAVQQDTLRFSPATQQAARFVRPVSVTIDNAIPSEDHDLTYQILKRGGDIALAASALILLAPVFFAIAILIGLSDFGPAFFRQDRLGARGKIFSCLKFRTMVVNAEQMLQEDPALLQRFSSDFKIKDDPRITPIGKFLRRTSLDELPQLFNILRGEMSFIGPRPIIPPELEKYGAYGAKLLSVKPGLGGIWQACGRSVITYEERIALDMIYVDQCSVKTDFQLMLMTVSSIFQKSDAF